MVFFIGFSGNVPLKSPPSLLLFLTNSFHLGKYHLPGKRQSLRRYQRKNSAQFQKNFQTSDPLFSVTSINYLSRLLEKVIIQRFLWPGLWEEGCLEDQFGFRPTSSTTAALIDITHFIYSKFNEGSDYARCLLIDHSRAFDTVDHSILFPELRALNLLLKIYNWIVDFLTGRSQCVQLQSIRSALAVISRNVIQGSRKGPYLYILVVRKFLRLPTPLSPFSPLLSLCAPSFPSPVLVFSTWLSPSLIVLLSWFSISRFVPTSPQLECPPLLPPTVPFQVFQLLRLIFLLFWLVNSISSFPSNLWDFRSHIWRFLQQLSHHLWRRS